MPSLSNIWSREEENHFEEPRRIRLTLWPWGALREVYVDGERCTLYRIIITQSDCELLIQLGPHSEITTGPGWHSVVTVG